MQLSSDAPPAELLAATEAGLRDAGFRIKDSDATGFRARHVRWWALLAAEAPTATNLQVRVDRDGVAVSTDATWLETRVSKRAGRGLQSAVAMLRQRGFTVQPTEWTSA